MKKIFLALGLLLISSIAEAQTTRNPCYTTGATTTQGILNCIGVGTSSPLPTGLFANGIGPAQISLDGALSVNTPASPQFADSFSAALDTTTNWTAKNSTGTAAVASGQLVINSSTTASAWGGVSSQQLFAPVGVSPQVWGVLASFTVLAQANSVRVFGMFTVPATPTTAVPVTDGYIFRLDGTGKLFAEIWSSGTAVSSTDVTTSCLPAAGFPGIFAVNYRASLVQFTCGAATVTNLPPVLGINPVNQVLPVSALSIAGSTPPAASAVMNLSAIALATISPGAVKSGGQSPTVNDPTNVVAISPNGNAVAGDVASSVADSGNPIKVGGVYKTSPPSLTSGNRSDLQLDQFGNSYSHSISNLSSGSDGFGNGQLSGPGVQNNTGFVTMPMSASFLFNGTAWDRIRAINGSVAAGTGTIAVAIAPTSAATGGITPVVSAAVEGSHILKASAGNFYSLVTTTGGTAGYVMVFNAVSAPADGAVTPAECVAVAANSTVTINYNPGPPTAYATGITAVFSSTGCFTKTISNTAFFSGKVS